MVLLKTISLMKTKLATPNDGKKVSMRVILNKFIFLAQCAGVYIILMFLWGCSGHKRGRINEDW